MEPEGSLPDSQEPGNCPYPEPAPSTPNLHIPLPEDPSSIAVNASFKHASIMMTHLIQDKKIGVIMFSQNLLFPNKTGIIAK